MSENSSVAGMSLEGHNLEDNSGTQEDEEGDNTGDSESHEDEVKNKVDEELLDSASKIEEESEEEESEEDADDDSDAEQNVKQETGGSVGTAEPDKRVEGHTGEDESSVQRREEEEEGESEESVSQQVEDDDKEQQIPQFLPSKHMAEEQGNGRQRDSSERSSEEEEEEELVDGRSSVNPLEVVLEDAASPSPSTQQRKGQSVITNTNLLEKDHTLLTSPSSPSQSVATSVAPSTATSIATSTNSADGRRSVKSPKKPRKRHSRDKTSSRDKSSSKDRKDRTSSRGDKTKIREKERKEKYSSKDGKSSNYAKNHTKRKSDDSITSTYDGFEDGDQYLLNVETDSTVAIPRMSTSSKSRKQPSPEPVEEKVAVDWIVPGIGKTANNSSSHHKQKDDDDSTITEDQQHSHTSSKEALYALHLAASAAQQFEKHFNSIKNPQLENMTPLYRANEVLASREPIRFSGYFTEYSLTAIRMIEENTNGDRLSYEEEQQQNIRRRFMERSIDGYYSVKYVQPGLIEATEHGGTAAADMIFETRILMNLRPQHPNISPIYGVNSGGIDSFLETATATSPRAGFFFITDRIVTTLPEKIEIWRKKKEKESSSGSKQDRRSKLEERMSIAFDIASALVFLHSRNVVYHIRPDKIGFDAKQEIVKLYNFSQARCSGMRDHQSQAITRSDDMKILAYTAPEALCKEPCTTSCDVYAFGIMLWELMSLRIPFEGYDRARHFHQVVQQQKRPPMNKKWSREIRELLPGCWDPHLRYTMRAVNESLEKVLMLISEEQNQISIQKSLKKSSKSKTSTDRTDGASTVAGNDRENRLARRYSTGAAENFKKPDEKVEIPDSPQKNRNRRKMRRQSSSGASGLGLTNLKDHFKAAKRAADEDDEARTYAPSSSKGFRSGGKSSSRSVFGGGKVDNSDARSVTSSASAFLRSYKSPRRSTLGHVPANVKRQPLFRRNKDDGEASKVDHESNTSNRAAQSQSSSNGTQSTDGPGSLTMHLQQNADRENGSPPSSPKSLSPMRTIRKKLSSMRNVFAGQPKPVATLLDNDDHEQSEDDKPAFSSSESPQPLAPPSPPGNTGRGRKSRRSSFA